MHNVLSLKQKKRKPPHKVHLASLTHGEARLNHKMPFWSDFTTYSFVFDTSVCQSPSSAHKLINTKKKVDCTGLKFLYLCMYACKRDEIQLHVYFLLDYLCVFIYIYIYTCVCLGPARFFLWQHLQTYSTEDVRTLNLRARENRAAEREAESTEWSPDKNGDDTWWTAQRRHPAQLW